MTRREIDLKHLAELRRDYTATKSLLNAVQELGYDEVIKKLESAREWSEVHEISIVQTLIYFNKLTMQDILNLRFELEDNCVTIIKGDKRIKMDIATYIEYEGI